MDKRIENAAEAIIATRDFCGNEAEALHEWEADNGSLTNAQRDDACQLANGLWRKAQAEAGVTSKYWRY